MQKHDKAVNAGVHNSTGIEFQKHCALLFIFKDFDNFSKADYFITIENEDDVVFCFRDSEKKIKDISAYQIKKSSSEWTLSKDMIEIIKKIITTGNRLLTEKFERSDSYKHSLFFGSNNSIKFNNGKTTKTIHMTVNETNESVNFQSIDKEISENIVNKLGNIDKSLVDELNNLNFLYVDLPKTREAQLNCLVGKSNSLFGKSIIDHKSAVESILTLFRKVETTYNQGSEYNLNDATKRIEGFEIREAINIVTNESRAFELWRSRKLEICSTLGIPISDRKSFISYFENSFDLFKDMSQSEYHKIYKYVQNSTGLFETLINEVELIQELFGNYKLSHDTFLSDLELKAVLFAAYVEVEAMYE